MVGERQAGSRVGGHSSIERGRGLAGVGGALAEVEKRGTRGLPKGQAGTRQWLAVVVAGSFGIRIYLSGAAHVTQLGS